MMKKKTQRKQVKEKKEKYNFWKAKLDTDYDSGKILTSVFIRDAENPTAKPKRVPVDTPTQLEQFLKWGSKVRMIVMMNKAWAEKQPKEQGMDRKYGFGFKIMSLEITPSNQQSSFRTEVQNYAFIDKEDGETNQAEERGEEEEEEKEQEQEEEQEEEEQEQEQEAEAEEAEPEEEEEEEEEEEPEEEVPQPKAKGGGGKKAAPTPVPAPSKSAPSKGKSKK